MTTLETPSTNVQDIAYRQDMRESEKRILINFNHIPKCGGTSIRASLEQAGLSVRRFRHFSESRKLTDEDRDRLDFITSTHLSWGYHEPFANRKILHVAMVRDPLERVISWYNYSIAKPNFIHKQVKGMSLEEFVDYVYDSDNPHEVQKRYTIQTWSTNIQCRLLCGKPQFSPAKQAVENLYHLVYPVTFSNSFVKKIFAIFDLKMPEGVKRHNVSNRVESIDSIDDGIKKKIYENNFEDYKLFTYVTRRHLNNIFK